MKNSLLKMITPTVWIFLGVFCIKTTAFSQGTRLLRQTTLSKDQVAFVYADDLWIVQKNGGAARRLTSHEVRVFRIFHPMENGLLFQHNMQAMLTLT